MALTAQKAQTSLKKNQLTLLVRVYTLAKPHQQKAMLAVMLTFVMAVLGPLRPYLVQYTIDNFIATGNMPGLTQMSGLIFMLLVLQSAMQMWSTVLSNYLAQHVIKNLRLQVYDYLTGLRLIFYDKTPIGTMVTRTINDIETLADVFSEGLINISGDILQIIFILIFMFSTHWQLALVSLSVLPLLLYAGYVFKEKVRFSFEDVRNQVAKLNTFVQEHIQGMQVVQVFNREQQEFEKFNAINVQHRNANIKSVMYYSVFFPVVEIIAATSTALIVWYGAQKIIGGTASIGMITSFIMYINLFFRPIRQLADRFNTMQMGLVAAERLFKLIDDKQPVEPIAVRHPEKIIGNIAFKNVYFGYTDDTMVLNNLSFSVHAGQTLAIVGSTGSGKSTIINLISKFYQPQKGSITIDGQDLEQLNTLALRKQVAVVLQDVFLFSGSVMDNIKLNNSSISDEKVIEISKLLGAHNFISKLPDGYQQNVQERGVTLSLGQRQLISFIRAMVTNPAVVVLDEATSSVDNETEEVLQQAVKIMMKNRTAIVIAHRLSTIVNADKIMVINKGQIIEEGTHQELINLGGQYQKLYQLQFNQYEKVQ